MNERKKNYVQGAGLWERNFDNGGSLINMRGDAAKFCAWIMSISDHDGKFKCVISRRMKRDTERDPTHNMYEDEWKASRTNDNPPRNDSAQRPEFAPSQHQQGAQSPDNLPF
jgi:hypothetical protein